MARPKVHDDQLAEALLDESAAMVAEGGPNNLSLRKLTEAVGTSTSAVYTLYGSREALMQAVYDRAIGSFTRSQEIPETDRPEYDLFNMGMAYRRWALDNPKLYPVMFLSPTGSEPEDKRAVMGPTVDRLTRSIKRCCESGYLDPNCDAKAMAIQLWSMVHGYVSLELMGLLTPEVTGRTSKEIDASYADILRLSVSSFRKE